MIEIEQDDLSGAPTRALLALHLTGMRASSPAESVHALDFTSLVAPGVRVWSAWIGGDIAGIAALRQLGDGSAEIKSMRTHPAHLRKGVASALLEHIIGEARSGGLSRLSLETGSGVDFEPALELYKRRGFHNGAPFADYVETDFNQFLHLAI